MSRRTSPPLEAILLPEPNEKPRRSWIPFIMGSIVVASVVGGVVLGIWGLIRLMEEGPSSSRGSWTASPAWPPKAEKQAEFRQVFRVPAAPVADADLAQIEHLLERYVTAARHDEKGGLARLVDVDRFERRMEEHPEMPRLSGTSRRELRERLNRELQLPERMVDFRIVGVKRLESTGEAMVDVVLKDSLGSYDPYRFCLRKNQRSWVIIDWESIQEGMSEAEKWISSQRASQDWLAQSHRDCLSDLQKADSCSITGNLQGAVDALHTADGRTVPYYTQKELQYCIALRFKLYGQFAEAIESCRKIQPPEDVPGVYVLRAICHEALGHSEEALEAAAAYEELCGFAPEVVLAKSKALERLGKSQEARNEVKRLLEFDPSHLLALRSFCRLLGPKDKGELVEMLAKAKEPQQLALSLGSECLARDDDESLQAIAEFLETRWKSSPAAHLLAAQRHRHNEENDQAAACFRQAFVAETDRVKKQAHWRSYVEAMAAAGKLVQAYEESKDPAEIFRHLTTGLEDGESIVPGDKLASLIEAHRKRAPDDPQLYYCAGWMAREQGDLAGSEREFATGMAKAKDDEMKSRLRYEHTTVMAEQGRILEAYRLYESEEDAFSTLCEACRSQHKPDVLEELIRRRRNSHPGNVNLSYYEIVLPVERGRYAEALNMLKQRAAAADEETGVSAAPQDAGNGLAISNGDQRLLQLKVQIYEKYEPWAHAVGVDSEFAQIMPLLAARLQQHEQWDKLRQLLDLYRTRYPSDAHLWLFEMRWSWHARDYGRIEDLVPRWFGEQWKGLPEYEQRWARETVVRALLRQGKTTAAYGFAEQFQRENNDELPMLMTRIAQGNVDEVKGILTRATDLLYYNFAQDSELLPYLTDSRFAELRREFPRDLPVGSPRLSVVLFLREPLTLDAKQLQVRVALTGQVEVVSIPGAVLGRQTLALRHAQGTCFVTAADTQYCKPDAAKLRELRDEGTKTALKEHKGWLAIDLLDDPAAQIGPQADSVSKRLAVALCDENVLAIGVWQRMGSSILGKREGARPELLLPDRPWRDWLPQGEDVWLPRPIRSEGQELTHAARRKAARTMAAAVAKLPAGQFGQVKVPLNFGHVDEEVWLKVAAMEKKDYGAYRIIGELQKDSQTWPHLKAGERCTVDWWPVLETRLPPKEGS